MPRFLVSLVLFLVLGLFVDAQRSGGSSSTSQTSTTPSSTLSLSLSLTTGVSTVVLATTISGRATQVTTTVPGIVSNVTYTITPSTSASATASSTPSPTSDPYVLATKVDPAFAVLGVILILTGLPSAFWGHKNRWTSFFLIGFYTLSLVCIVLILKFGVIPAVHPPSQTVRGMFVLASTIAGFAGGAIAIFFWKAARYGIGAWGGFALALWIQCFRNGGVIRPIGYRWILNIGCGVIGFMLATIPKIHYHIVLISTAIVGASSFILGVDCFTTAGLKEFYIWNLGFPGMFPKYQDNGIQFPVTQQMQIELGLIGAITLMGMAVQFRVLKVLQKKMREIAEENRRVDEEAELKAADKIDEITRERDEWEKEHGGGYDLGKHGRQQSNLSSMPLLRHDSTPSPEQNQDDTRRRNVSGLSEFMAAPTSDEDFKRTTRHTQPAGSLPALDLGLGIEEEVPSNYIAKDVKGTAADIEALKRKHDLLLEIQTLRRSIDVLKTESSPTHSIADQSRRPSLTSRRTISFDANNALLPLSSHARPPRGLDPRARVHSLELSSMMPPDPISRPNSVPLKDADWDKYIQERKLLQPPSGVTPPIVTSAAVSPADRVPVAPAVQEALQRRKHRESVLASGGGSSASSEDVPLVRYAQQQQQQQAQKSINAPVTILPPRRSSGQILAPIPQSPPPARTRTFEELNERHREKMRDLQAPLTQATKEHAELEAAKQRWERAKTLEKEAVTRRQAEKAAALEKDRKKKANQHRDSFRGRSPGANGQRNSKPGHGHARSLSAEMLGGNSGQGAMTTSSKRLSVMKVEDWQRYQEAEIGQKSSSSASPGPNGLGSKRDSRAMRQEGGVPFPHELKPPHSRRKSRDMLT
ncbi:hypothetical protein CPB83DRAFT_821301 [Crepidotus variabilis]|uniref:TM7S3/TM198-like domain-containing protein n=1 Tax=Crepidotus variabilis TaxID=179855 RepID=A0A9P6E6V5_9AGAR|nr:hypothetical protein CPB83DRAFT_821301 [Crepidotus variabilis]